MKILWRGVCRYFRPIEINIEPGESHTETVEFIIPSWLKTVRIYTYLKNATVKDYGWYVVTIYDVKGAADDNAQPMVLNAPFCAYD